MAKAFEIRPGRYLVPNIGRVDTTVPLTNEQKVALYTNKKFPFIVLKPQGVSVLKSAKLSTQQIALLIRYAKSEEEVNLILEVKNNKTLKRIADLKVSEF